MFLPSEGIIIAGIDPGTHTGIALWNVTAQKFEYLASMPIHRAFKLIEEVRPAFVRVEDARKRKWFGKWSKCIKCGAASDWQKQINAGQAKRDAAIWEGFLADDGTPFEMVAPKENKTKRSAEEFRRVTGWTEQTNEHSRDAGGLVFGYSMRNLENSLRDWK